jgi:hypothetical protein
MRDALLDLGQLLVGLASTARDDRSAGMIHASPIGSRRLTTILLGGGLVNPVEGARGPEDGVIIVAAMG